MFKALVALFAVAYLAQVPRSQQPLGAGGRIPVLLISGSDTFHNWRETTPLTRNILEETGRFDVRVVEDVHILESKSALARYRLILFNQQVESSTAFIRKNLTAYLTGGGGLLALHWAVDNFHDWPEFANVLGRTWEEGISKEEHGRFHVHIIDGAHRSLAACTTLTRRKRRPCTTVCVGLPLFTFLRKQKPNRAKALP